jgi:hypothetical protein
MKKINLKVIYIVLLVYGTMLLNSSVSAQPAGTVNFLSKIKVYNLSVLWRADQLKLLSLKETELFPEPLGVLGKNYQRFYIHYTAVKKDLGNPYVYHVTGKTRVGKQVRPFTGTITVKQAGTYKAGSPYAPEPYKGYIRGQIICRVVLKEAISPAGSGIINGELISDFCINAQGQFLYDTLDYGMDGYGNNQFTGTHTVYNSKIVQNLQYGDVSFSDSRFNDTYGITVPAEYEKYGWQSFVNAISNYNRPASKAALAEEKRQWWKE